MTLIASADRNWAIGSNNQLLVRIPDDMRFFREITTGKAVVMGRKTKESLPEGILPGRTNIVLTHDQHYKAKGAVIVHSLDELHKELVIGGESVYRQLLDECDTAHITKIDFAYSADARLPNLDELPQWELTAESEEQTYFDIVYYFRRYERKM